MKCGMSEDLPLSEVLLSFQVLSSSSPPLPFIIIFDF